MNDTTDTTDIAEKVDDEIRARIGAAHKISRSTMRKVCPQPRKAELLEWNWSVLDRSFGPLENPPKARRPQPPTLLKRFFSRCLRSIEAPRMYSRAVQLYMWNNRLLRFRRFTRENHENRARH